MKPQENNPTYDAAIIGTGPAGLSAAITLKLRGKNIVLLGSSSLSKKIEKAHLIENYPGLPSITGEELSAKFHEHLSSMGIQITEDMVTTCYSLGDQFSLTARSGITYNAKTVILACGINFGKPYPGEEQFLGRGVSYCATCDAPLYKGKTVAVIAQSQKEEAEARYLAQLCQKVYYIPLYKEEPALGLDNIQVVRDQVQSIAGTLKAKKLVLKETQLEADGFFILRESVSPGQLVPGLEIAENHVKVNRSMETNLPGLYACGDITGLPYQYIKSAGEGNVAALSAVRYLDR